MPIPVVVAPVAVGFVAGSAVTVVVPKVARRLKSTSLGQKLSAKRRDRRMKKAAKILMAYGIQEATDANEGS